MKAIPDGIAFKYDIGARHQVDIASPNLIFGSQKRGKMSLNIQDGNSDFKYIMNDLTLIYFGAKYSYAELLNEENVSLQFQSVIRRYILPNIDRQTTLESHLYYMSPEDEEYEIFVQMRAKVRLVEPEVKKGLFGGSGIVYKEKLVPIRELAAMNPAAKQQKGIMIRELQISKVGLMGLL